jgi:hypothetical protein
MKIFLLNRFIVLVVWREEVLKIMVAGDGARWVEWLRHLTVVL